MIFRRRIISALDKERVLEAIDYERGSWASYAPSLDLFQREVRRTPALKPADVPVDAITLHSRFALMDLRTEERTSYTLVYPDEEARREGRISVASQMGAALLGARVGDEVFWDSSDGPVVARVVRIHYQPEAAAPRPLAVG
jgi:regulator of nucleoside diphosphate kinase